MQYFYWRLHVDVTHTKEEVKEMAAEVIFFDVMIYKFIIYLILHLNLITVLAIGHLTL